MVQFFYEKYFLTEFLEGIFNSSYIFGNLGQEITGINFCCVASSVKV